MNRITRSIVHVGVVVVVAGGAVRAAWVHQRHFDGFNKHQLVATCVHDGVRALNGLGRIRFRDDLIAVAPRCLGVAVVLNHQIGGRHFLAKEVVDEDGVVCISRQHGWRGRPQTSRSESWWTCCRNRPRRCTSARRCTLVGNHLQSPRQTRKQMLPSSCRWPPGAHRQALCNPRSNR